MKSEKRIYDMTDRELRAYKWKKRRIRERRRKYMMAAATTFLTLCLVAVFALSYHAIRSNASAGEENLSFKYYTEITVSRGDTLWDIAEEYIDYDFYKNKDAYIAEVESINHLDAEDDIRAGQRLIVPYYSEEFVK